MKSRVGALIKWDYFVDLATVVWLVLFILGMTNQASTPDLLVNGMLAIFLADLVVKYRREPDFKTFLKKRWIDIILVMPWFRAFRFLKFIRFLRLLRIVLQAERFRRKSLRLYKRFNEHRKA